MHKRDSFNKAWIVEGLNKYKRMFIIGNGEEGSYSPGKIFQNAVRGYAIRGEICEWRTLKLNMSFVSEIDELDSREYFILSDFFDELKGFISGRKVLLTEKTITNRIREEHADIRGQNSVWYDSVNLNIKIVHMANGNKYYVLG